MILNKKKYLFCGALLFSIVSYGQQIEKVKQSTNTCFSCEKIKNMIRDTIYYKKLPNGKPIMARPRKDGLFIVVIDGTRRFYYVSKLYRDKIVNSIEKNNCKGITVKDVSTLNKAALKKLLEIE